MKLEDQVCSLELAKRLKELGVKQESYFCWQPIGKVGNGGTFENTGTCRLVRYEDQRGAYAYSKTFAAFTVADLGEMLPIFYSQFRYAPPPPDHEVVCDGHSERADTEANARAKMLVYLLEQGIINP